MTLLESLKRHARARYGYIYLCTGRTWREGVDMAGESCYYQRMEEHNDRH